MNTGIQATNSFVLVKRDEAKKETSGLLIPGQGIVKPNTGTVLSIGDVTADKNIRKAKAKKALFHSGSGFEMEYEGETYLVLEDKMIIAIV
jgi:chaperonin GroES